MSLKTLYVDIMFMFVLVMMMWFFYTISGTIGSYVFIGVSIMLIYELRKKIIQIEIDLQKMKK